MTTTMGTAVEERLALLDARIQELEKGSAEKLSFLDSIIQALENVGPVEEKLTVLDSRIQELEKLAFLDSRIQELENGSGSSEHPASPVEETLALLDARIQELENGSCDNSSDHSVTQRLDSRIRRLESMTASRIKQIGSTRDTQNIFVVEESEPLELDCTLKAGNISTIPDNDDDESEKKGGCCTIVDKILLIFAAQVNVALLGLKKPWHIVLMLIGVALVETIVFTSFRTHDHSNCDQVTAIIDGNYEAAAYIELFQRPDIHFCSSMHENPNGGENDQTCDDFLPCTLNGLDPYEDYGGAACTAMGDAFGKAKNGCDEYNCWNQSTLLDYTMDHDNITFPYNSSLESPIERDDLQKCANGICANGNCDRKCKGYVSVVYFDCPQLLILFGAAFATFAFVQTAILIIFMFLYDMFSGQGFLSSIDRLKDVVSG